LLQHSEKIVVALRLISTSSSKPTRVFKNLRVYGDCHAAFKHFSIVRGREVEVRDANRFHHFKDGTRSCNDYWQIKSYCLQKIIEKSLKHIFVDSRLHWHLLTDLGFCGLISCVLDKIP